MEEGDSIDASWTINDPSIGTRVAIKVDTKLLRGLVNLFAPLQVSTEDQEEIDETYHVLWEDSTTSELYGHEEYLNAKALFDSNLEQFRKPRTKFSKSRIYVDDYEICFNSNWFEAAIEFYDSPTFTTCENMNTFIVLGFVKFLHELFYTFTDFILDSEWFYKQRATSTVIQRYPAIPPRIGVRFAKSKHLLGDLGYAAEEILFGNHRRLKVTLDPRKDWWLPNLGIFFEIGEVMSTPVQTMEASESSLVTSVAKFQRSGQSSSKQQHGLKTPRTKTPKQKAVIKTASKRIASYSEIHAIEGKQESGDVKEEEEMAIISEERFENHSDRIKYQIDNCKHIESIASSCCGEDFMGFLHGLQVIDELLEPVPNIKPLHRRVSKKDKSRKFAEGLSLADLYAEDFPSMAIDFQDDNTSSLDFQEASIAKLPVDSRGALSSRKLPLLFIADFSYS